MPLCETKVFSRLVLRICVVFWCGYTTAQLRQTYSGRFQLRQLEGHAEYGYKLVGNDSIFDGPFHFKQSNLEALLQNSDSSFSIIGAFDMGIAQGPWRFQFGEFQTDSTAKVVDYQYQLNVNGIQREAFGHLSEGKPDGIWNVKISRIKNSELNKVLFHSTIEFEKGVPQKSFSIQNESKTVVGRFLRDGLAHDQWTLYQDDVPEVAENWNFNEGWLTTIELYSEESPKESTLYRFPKTENFREITMDSRYFQVLRLEMSQNRQKPFFQSGLSAALAANAVQYQTIDGLLSSLGTSSFYPDFKVKVGYHPLDSTERQAIKEIEDLHRVASEQCDFLLNNTQLNLLKLTDPQAAYLYRSLKAVADQMVAPIGSVLALHSEQVLDLVSRETLLKGLWPNGRPSTTLVLEGTTLETYTGPNAEAFDFSGNTLNALLQIMRYAAASMQQITDRLTEKLAQDQRQQEYLLLEEQLIAKRDGLGQDIASAQGRLSDPYQQAMLGIQNLVTSELAEYSKMSESNDKLKMGRRLIVCFDALTELAALVAKQPERDQVIAETYVDEVWNPFMATIMNEEVKKRLVGSYHKILVPYLMQRTQTVNCEQVEPLTQLFEGAYERMLQLRQEETRKLERKLKRTLNPTEVIQLFNLQPLSEN